MPMLSTIDRLRMRHNLQNAPPVATIQSNGPFLTCRLVVRNSYQSFESIQQNYAASTSNTFSRWSQALAVISSEPFRRKSFNQDHFSL